MSAQGPAAGRGPRLPRVERADATPEQVRVLDELLAARGKPGGRLANLYAMMLHRPEVARRMGAVGAYCRFHSSPDELVREAAILAVCLALDFGYETAAHEEIARARGMPATSLEALRQGAWAELPAEMAVAVRFVRAAIAGPVDDDVIVAVRAAFGVSGLVDLTAMAAHYSALAVYDRVLRPDPDPPGNALGRPAPEPDGGGERC